jgi:large subunit ribosomal protein L25
MATTETTALSVEQREPGGSRAARQLRRTGKVPGVVYGGAEGTVAFQVDSRALRAALAHRGAVLELRIDGDGATPVVVKELARHPVSGETIHVDLLRVRLDKPIQATVVVELTGVEEAPGVKEGGVLEHVTREVTIEALPTDIPDNIRHDVSELVIGDTVMLEAVRAPAGVTIIDDPETVVATLTPPRLQAQLEELEAETEIEEETELVAEGEVPEEGEAPAEEGAEEGAGEGQAEGEGGE